MPDRAYLHPIDPELLPGGRNAIDVCLRLKPQERITIITDTATREIAAALQKQVERVGSDYSLFVLEHHSRQMGQPSRRRNLHRAHEHKRHIRRRWRGWRLSLRTLRRSAIEPAHDRDRK